MDITVHKSVKEYVHEQLWCPLVGFLMWHPQTSFSNKTYIKVNSVYLFGLSSFKTTEDFVSV